MRRSFLIAAILCLSACVSAPTLDPAEIPAGQFELDPAHAAVVWRVKHFGVSYYVGRFNDLDASLDFNPSEPEASRLTAVARAGSIDTGDPDFDDDLRGGGWFAADRFPDLTFSSTRIEPTGPNTGIVEGELSIRDVTLPARMDVTFHGSVFNFLAQTDAIGFTGLMAIDRTAFGVDQLAPDIVGVEVEIRIDAEFLRAS